MGVWGREKGTVLIAEPKEEPELSSSHSISTGLLWLLFHLLWQSCGHSLVGIGTGLLTAHLFIKTYLPLWVVLQPLDHPIKFTRIWNTALSKYFEKIEKVTNPHIFRKFLIWLFSSSSKLLSPLIFFFGPQGTILAKKLRSAMR